MNNNDLQKLETRLKRKIYADSYYQFFKWSFNILEPQTKLEDTFHIKYLCALLQSEVERIIRKEAKGKDIIINIPPRTSKSKILSQALLAWVWIKAPYIKMICVSYSDKLSLSNASYCKDIIKSDQYQELFGDLFAIRSDIDSKERFANTKGGERLSTTIGGSITGFGAELVLVDDPQNPSTAESEIEREKVVDYWNYTLYNRLTPLDLGIRVLLQQRLHVEDLSGYLLSNQKESFTHICLPAELSNDVNPPELKQFYVDGLLDPVRLNKIEIAKLKKLGSRYYAGQYQQIPSPEEGGIIKKEWFTVVDAHTLSRDIVNEAVHFIIDSAYTAKTENDPSAIMACFKKGNFLYVLDVVEVWLEFPELIKFIIQYTGKYQYNSQSKIIIEPKASGISIAQTLRSQTRLNVIESKNPTVDKVTRVHAVTPQMESKRVILVNGAYIPNYISQLGSFPNGSHDDMVDVTTIAINEFLVSNNPDFMFM